MIKSKASIEKRVFASRGGVEKMSIQLRPKFKLEYRSVFFEVVCQVLDNLGIRGIRLTFTS